MKAGRKRGKRDKKVSMKGEKEEEEMGTQKEEGLYRKVKLKKEERGRKDSLSRVGSVESLDSF